VSIGEMGSVSTSPDRGNDGKIYYRDYGKGVIMRYLIVLTLVLIILTSGCTSSTAPASVTSSSPEVYLTNITGGRIEYNWYEAVVNDDSVSHSVFGYVDFYDKDDVKVDHLAFFVDVDAHGKTAFSVTSTEVSKITGTYKYYIDSVH